jgi:hypothetical protein
MMIYPTLLLLEGNKDAQLLTAHNQRKDANRSLHTWSIVDKSNFMKWFVSTVN